MEYMFTSLWTTVPTLALEMLLLLGHEVLREEKRQFVTLLLLNCHLNKLLAHCEVPYLSLSVWSVFRQYSLYIQTFLFYLNI